MNQRFHATLIVTLFVGACATQSEGAKTGTFVPRDVNGAPYLPLSLPMAKLDLPMFLVGQHQVPSTGCLIGQPAAGPVVAADSIRKTFEKESNYAAEMRATFEKYLVDAKLDASLAHSLTETWEVQLDGPITTYTVDPAKVSVNFANEKCTEADLNWFKDNRPVGVTGIHATKVRVTAKSNLSNEASLKLDAAIAKINADFHAGFSKSAATGQTFELSASDVFVGVQATPLKSQECTAEMDVTPGTEYEICAKRYRVRLESSAVPSRFTFAITPLTGATATYSEAYGKQEPHALGESRMVYVDGRAGAKPHVRVTILFVAPDGSP
jgi:hypothetical protein